MTGIAKKYIYNDVSGMHFPDANAGDELYYAIDLTCLQLTEGEEITSVAWITPNNVNLTDAYLNSDASEAHVRLATPQAGIYRVLAEVNTVDNTKMSTNRLRIMLKVI